MRLIIRRRLLSSPIPDCDGVSSTAIMYNSLKNFTENVTYFHNQRSLGHGIKTALKSIPEGTQLLIIVDSSSSDTEACKELGSSGIDIIILDHHLIEKENPNAIIVNPQQKDCDYPNKKLSGSAVAWKVTQALDQYFAVDYSDDFLDLVAIGLLGDQMSMLEYENRYLVQKGLDSIRNKGIKALLSVFGKSARGLSSTDILYSIAPTINAACRLDQIETALELLTEEDPKLYKQLAQDIVKLNEERKVIQAKYYNELVDLIDPSDRCSIIINNDIGAGYRGLLAGDLSGEFKKPVMVLSESEDDTYKGSFRSYNNFDLKSILNSIPEVIYAAGHPAAGGIKFKRSDLHIIKEYLNENLPSLKENDYLEYIMEFNLEELNEALIKDVELFYRISGNGFETGNFLIRNVLPLSKQILGKERNTIKIPCYPADKAKVSRGKYDSLTPSHCLMKFRTNEDYFQEKYIYKELNVIGTLNFNEYKNPRTGKVSKTGQVFVEDFQIAF